MAAPKKDFVEKYGLKFPLGTTRLNIELFCLRHDTRGDYEGGRLSSFDHYKNAVNCIFNNQESVRRHIWSDESEAMATAFLGKREDKQFLGVCGSSSSGKSDCLGLFLIVMYLSSPLDTLCIATSTTIEQSKGRVWKAVREYWTQVERFFKMAGHMPPGKSVHSKCRIRGLDPSGEYSDATGLFLAAADKNKGAEATSNLMGVKVPGRGLLILGADELPDLAPNILTVAYTNLVNNPKFWMFGLGNPNLRLDAHGKFCEPIHGWDSVKHAPMTWRTQRGRVIRFEAENSSRIREEESWTEEERKTKRTRYFWQPDWETIKAAERQFGRSSRYFDRMYRAFWSDAKAQNAVYSEAELMKAGVSEEPEWDNSEAVVPVSGLDSSFTSGGDRSIAVWGLCGKVNGITRLHFSGTTNLEINDNLDLPASHQVVRAWVRECRIRGVRPKAAGFDYSGAGKSFASIVEMEWSPDVRKIDFGGAPSDRVHRLDGVRKEEFANRMSELWVQPKEYIRGERDSDGEFHTQITGITPTMIEEAVSRHYDDAGEGSKLKVERKQLMRKRTGKSPDEFDAAVICIEVAIQNNWLVSQEEKQILKGVRNRWQEGRGRIRYKTRKFQDLRFR